MAAFAVSTSSCASPPTLPNLPKIQITSICFHPRGIHPPDPRHATLLVSVPTTAGAAAPLSFKSRAAGGRRPAAFAARKAAASAPRGAALRVRADLEPDNISVLVAGGSGVAMDVVRQLKAGAYTRPLLSST
jgi:hypothetical protein